jgi:hypothetical protein
MEICLWRGATNTRIWITNNSTHDEDPAISGGNVVWTGYDENDYNPDIYLWNGVSTSRLSSDGISSHPAIFGSNVVWHSLSDGDYEIYLWNGVSTTQLTNNSTWDEFPAISGSKVVWEQGIGDGNTDEIFFWDGFSTTQLTNDSTRDQRPALSGSTLVWQRWDWDEYEIYTSTLGLIDPVPSISPGGLALLAVLVLGIVVWARRCS